MKKLLYLLSIIVTLILIVNFSKKITRNYRLNLTENFYLEDKFSKVNKNVEAILIGKDYSYSDSSKQNYYTRNEYGYVDKLLRINEVWVGRIAPYEETMKNATYFWDDEDMSNLILKEKLKEYAGYFVVDKDFVQKGMTEDQLKNYLSEKKLNFKNPSYYIESLGTKENLEPKYLEKNEKLIEAGKNPKTIKNYEDTRRFIKNGLTVLLIFEIIGFVMAFKRRIKRAVKKILRNTVYFQ